MSDAKKPPCQGCPDCCRIGCTWKNASATQTVVEQVLIPSAEYGCIHGGDVVRNENGQIGLYRTGKIFTGFAPLTDKGREFILANRPELATAIGLQG